MTQGKLSKEEAKSCREALDEIMKAMPKSKVGDFFGHFNDIYDVVLTFKTNEGKDRNGKKR